MPRPKRKRRISAMPCYDSFKANHPDPPQAEPIIMSIDEYEAVRLIDYENFTQEQCAQYMKVGRTTVQQMYTDARKKLAMLLVDGRELRIRGGMVDICPRIMEEEFFQGRCRHQYKKNQ